MKDILKATVVIIGTVIGAGFATGQEIYLFFGKLGQFGFIALCISCIASGVIIYKVVCLSNKNNINSYGEFLEIIFKGKNTFFIGPIKLIVTWFLAVSFIVMCSGSRGIFYAAAKLTKYSWNYNYVHALFIHFY